MRQTLLIANHSLQKHLRSWQFLVELLPAVAIATFLFKYKYQSSYSFYIGTIGLYLAAQTMLTTALIFASAAQATSYPVLARLRTRTPFLLGNLLAALVPILLLYAGITIYLLAVPYLALVHDNSVDASLQLFQANLASVGLHPELALAAAGLLLLGGLAMLLNVGLLASLTALATPLVSSRAGLLVMLGLLATSVYSFSPDVPESLRFLADSFRLILLPLFGTYELARTGVLQPSAYLAVALAIFYLGLALFAANRLFRQRDLLLG